MKTILSNFTVKSKRRFPQALVLLVLVSVGILSQPALAETTQCTLADIDRDNDGLIEICDLEGLNAIRHQLDGSGYRASSSATKITAGCAESGCRGYELSKGLDFDDDASYSNAANKARWTTGSGWQPIGARNSSINNKSFKATFDGNGYTISNLMVSRLTANEIGLFGHTEAGAEIINIGLLDVAIQGYENVGGLVGYNRDSSITNSYATGSVKGYEDVGGLVGENRDGNITNSYVMSSVEGHLWVGGLAGWNVRANITNCYATGSVKGSEFIGGLFGGNVIGNITNSYAIGSVTGNYPVGGFIGDNWAGGNNTNSYWDKTTSGISNSDGGIGKTTTELQSPTGATGIYSSWSTNDWDFGTIQQYPALKYSDGTLIPNQRLTLKEIASLTSCGTTDIDQDNDGLIEICNLEGLNAIRHQLSGSSYKASASTPKITAGCPEDRCKGYELNKDLDFNDDDSYSSTPNKVIWTTGLGWQPIGTFAKPFNTTFKANKYSISKLMIARPSLDQVGLFGNIGSRARIEGVGLIDADVRGSWGVGGLAGYNRGGTITNSYVIGVVRGEDSIGGLVGDNYGLIINSYTNAEMSGDNYVGGIVGCNFSGGIVTNSYTIPRIDRSLSSSGGLLGYNSSRRMPANSYWDKEVSGIPSGGYGAGLTTEELQSPTTSTGIYSSWSTKDWDFGTSEQYPALKYRDGTLMPDQVRERPEGLPQIDIASLTSCGTADIDQDDDGLIEICDLEGLDAIRHQLDGSGYKASVSANKITAGCAEGGCKGYELNKDLDFNDDDSYSSTSNKVIWTTGSGWEPIGRYRNGRGYIDYHRYVRGWELLRPYRNGFESTFDGNGYTISNLMVNRLAIDKIGLFGYTTTGTEIVNVGVLNVDIQGREYVGGLVGFTEDSNVTNSYATGSINGKNHIGGLVGLTWNSDITNSSATSAVNGYDNAGGLVGLTWYSSITNSYATGTVNGDDNVGGLVGYNRGDRSITNSYAMGTVEGDSYVGGLVGRNGGNNITSSYATGSVKGGDFVGGLVGVNSNRSVMSSYATGAVEGEDFVGGLVGSNWKSSIKNNYATGSVKGASDVGGLVGVNWGGSITNSYVTGTVKGDSYVGGLVGDNRCSISSATRSINQCNITSSYWDETTSRMSSSYGGVGKTTTELQSPTGATGIYSSWSTNVWDFGTREQYPALKYRDGTLMPNQVRERPGGLPQIDIASLTSCGTADIDQDDDGLIEICNLEGLNAIRYQLDGSGYKASVSANKITAGCAEGGCKGYELNKDLDFNDDDSYSSTSNKVIWTTGSGWEPIGRYRNGRGYIDYHRYVRGWESLRPYRNGFESTFDGNGYTISNLMVNRLAIDKIGLFGYTTTGTEIVNVGVLNVDIQGREYVGGLVGFTEDSNVTNSYATGSINGKNHIGGLVGLTWNSDITNSSATSAVNGYDNAGGLVGLTWYSSITNSYATGTVNGDDNVGGLVGYNRGDRSITNSYAMGTVEGDSYVGGLVGRNGGNNITSSYATGSVKGGDFVGGLVGVNSNRSVMSSYATGAVEGEDFVGGLVGSNWKSSIKNNYATGSVKGASDVGGLVGVNWGGSITNSYVTGTVKGDSYVGGLVGDNRCSISSATRSINQCNITSSYWDKTTSRMSSSYGGVGKTTTELQSPTGATGIYSSWSTNVWDFGTREQYPALKYRDGILMPDQVRERPEEPAQIPQIEIAGVPAGAVGEGERITLTAYSTSSASSIPLIYQWRQISEEALFIEHTALNSVTLNVPEDYVAARSNTSDVVLALGVSSDVGSTTQQVVITIAKRNNGGIATLDVPSLNVRELVAPSIDLSGDPDGGGSNIGYQWQIRQSTQTAWVDVSTVGDTKETYTIPEETRNGTQYRVVVSYTDGQGYGEEVMSGAMTYERRVAPQPSIDIASLTSCGTADIDQDDDGLIEICDLEGLNAIRYQLDGSGYKASVSANKITAGCTAGGCKGYELSKDLDFNDDDSYSSISNKVIWTTGLGWKPIGARSTSFEWTDDSGWRPIRGRSSSFDSVFDGNGYTISNLMINRPTVNDIGLFGYTELGAEIVNVGLLDVDIQGYENVGGLVGVNRGNIITDSYATGSVKGDGEVGGLVGVNRDSNITNSHATSSVEGRVWVGGLVGSTSNGEITDSYATGSVMGDNYAGGLVGSTSNGDITGSYAMGSVKGNWGMGGLVGYILYAGDITNSYAMGSIEGRDSVGGLIGYSRGNITNSYATGSVKGDSDVGGLVGYGGGNITNSYAIGSVRGNYSVGGLVGDNYHSISITNSYWDKTTSGMSSSAGGVGKTTTELQSPITPGSTSTEIYYGWSANIWDFGTSEQYPTLKYRDGTLLPNQARETPEGLPQIEIAGVPTGAMNEGERITLTASSTSSTSSIPLIYQWRQTSGKTLLTSPTSGSSVTLNVPEDYVVASENTDNVVLILEASNDVGSTAQQVLITIAKHNNGGIAALGVPNLNERELTAPSIDLGGDPDGGGNNIRYQWQSRQGTQTEWVDVSAAGTNERYIIPANTAGIVHYRVVVSYTDGQSYEEQVESEASIYEGNTIPSIEIAGVPASAVDEGERITLTAFPHNSENNILPSYSWTQTSGKTLLTSPTSGNSVTLNVPEDYVAASENIGNVVLMLEASNDVGSTAQQVLITIAKSNNGGIATLGVPTLNERELTAPSIDLGGDPDGGGNNIRYQWQSKQGTQTEWANVPAAGTNALYTIPVDTEGIVQYRVVVSYADGQGYEEQVESGTSSYRGNTSPSIEPPGSVRLVAGQTTAVSVVISEVDVSDVVTLTIELTSAAGTIRVEPNRIVLGASLSETRTTQFQLTAKQVGSATLLLTAIDDSQTVTDRSDAVELTVEVEAAPFTSCGYADIDRDDDGLIEICNLEGLNAMRNQLFGTSYKENTSAPGITTGCAEGGCKGYELDKDLDFNDEGSYKDIANKAIWTTGEGWQPVGVRGNGFSSIFEGNSYTISNLMIDRSLTDDIGLFGIVDGQSKINGIGLLDVDINAQSRVGGLAGHSIDSNITNSYVTGNVIGQLTVGGLVGQCSNSRVSNSYAIGRVEAMGTIGGIDAGSSSAVGGLVGYLLSSSVSRSHAIGSVKGAGGYAGGLIGSNTGRNGSIITSYAFVDVEGGSNYTGGLVGSNNGINNKISNSYAIGKVTGENVVGGLAGHNRSRNTITNSYSFSNVKGSSQVGGLVGNNVGRIINSYAVGRVAGNVEQRDIGGLVGLGFTGGTNDSYWDKTTSGRATSVGGVGQTTAQLQAPTLSGSTPTEVYHGWSGEIWDFGTSEQYPALKYSDGTLMPDQRIGLLSLSALAAEELSIIFNTEVFDYRLLIDSGADAVQLLPTATHSDANINIVSGSDFSESVVSGSLSSAISLNTTATTLITIEVEFDSGASRSYRITISRAKQSAPAQVAEVDTPFEYTIPIGILMGANNDMNNYEVTSMPSWLRQTELQAGLMFSGTPEIDYMSDPLEQMIEIQIDNGDGTTQTLNLMLQIDSPTTGTVTLQELEGGILQLENELRDDNGMEEVTYIWEHCPVGANAFSELVGVDGMNYAIPQRVPYMGFGTAYRVRTTVVDGLGQRSEHTTQIELQSIFVPPVIRIRAKVFLEGFLQ